MYKKIILKYYKYSLCSNALFNMFLPALYTALYSGHVLDPFSGFKRKSIRLSYTGNYNSMKFIYGIIDL